MERVPFNIAKAIKDAGYPQRFTSSFGWYNKEGKYFDTSFDLPMSEKDDECVAPTYLDVWLWLWREKKICINCKLDKSNLLPMWWCTNEDGINYNTPNFTDPEEGIIAAINYLVSNDLIK